MARPEWVTYTDAEIEEMILKFTIKTMDFSLLQSFIIIIVCV